MVTATKRGEPENAQKVPIAISAFGANQLQAMNFQNLQSLTVKMPNVQLDTIGTTAGYANFSIRGLGINSSLPSIEPTVGVFVDGIYYGISAGVVFDNFDLAGIEVLRGPQGVLFGKNVTGGAVVVRTKTPTDRFEVEARVALESGSNKTANASVSGPIVKGLLDAKAAIYYNDDDGYFYDSTAGRTVGRANQVIYRGALRFTPSNTLESIFRIERGEAHGDGAIIQSGALFDHSNFDLAYDEVGFYKNYWNQYISETNLKVGFGEGMITNIAGWRDYLTRNANDIDGTPNVAFHNAVGTKQSQFSDELRYAGTFGPVKFTTGLYYFTQRIQYTEGRVLAGGTSQIQGGGHQKQHTYGAFAALDYQIFDRRTLNLGARYTSETKRAQVAAFAPGGCDVFNFTCNFTFSGKNTSRNLAPRAGLQFSASDEVQLYGFYAKGFRGGGYNFRQTNALVPPGPFGDEKQDSFELGMKGEFFDRLVRVNVAGFLNNVHGLQRDVVTPSPFGVSQVIVNAADARIQGVEAEITLRPMHDLVLSGQLGYVDAHYTKVLYDLSGDGVVNAADVALALPRTSPWTYGGSVIYDLHLRGTGLLSTTVSFNHRDKSFYNDANTGPLPARDQLDFDLTLRPVGRLFSISFYGKNLLNQVTYNINQPLPTAPIFGGPGASFIAPNKGRVFGGSLKINY